MNWLQRHKKATLVAVLSALYLRFGLPITAVGFYELYHLTLLDPVYWGYGAFKAAGYYFGTWQYQSLACVGVAAAILAIAWLWSKRHSHSGADA